MLTLLAIAALGFVFGTLNGWGLHAWMGPRPCSQCEDRIATVQVEGDIMCWACAEQVAEQREAEAV